MPLTIDGERIEPTGHLDVLVYGSCVARDLVELHAGTLSCVEYIARQSWVSAASPGIGALPEIGLASGFQARNLEGDLRSDALRRLGEGIGDAQIAILDIVDDRFGVVEVGGGYATPTAEFRAAKMGEKLEVRDHLAFGSDRHFAQFELSVAAVKTALGPLMPWTYVLGVYFGGTSVDGSEVAPASGIPSTTWNARYARYYALLEAEGFTVIMLPERLAVSTPHHTWGPAPFHYTRRAYTWWFEQMSMDRLRKIRELEENVEEKK